MRLFNFGAGEILGIKESLGQNLNLGCIQFVYEFRYTRLCRRFVAMAPSRGMIPSLLPPPQFSRK
jgi:hypothetical protein